MTTTLQRIAGAIITVLLACLYANNALGQACPAAITPAGLVSYCIGDSVKLSGPAGTNLSYQWRKNGVNLAGATSKNLWVKSFGSYDIRVSGTGCALATSAPVLVGPVSAPLQPNFTFTVPTGLCDTTGVQFSVLNPDNSLEYSWDFGDGSTATGEQVSHIFSAPGTAAATFPVKVYARLNQGCATASLEQNVTVNALPDASVADTVSGFSNCTYSAQGYSFDLTIINTSTTAATNTGYTINWGDGSSQALGSNFSNATHTYTTQGAFTLTVTATNAAGCSRTISYPVFNGNNPSFGVASQGNTNGCGPISYTFDILNTANNTPSTVYTFQFDDGTPPVIFNHPPPAQITHLFNNSTGGAGGSFTLTAFATNACGTTPATVGGIKVSKKPQAMFTVSPALNNCTNSPVTLTDNTIAGFNANNPTNPGLYSRTWSITPATGWTLVSGSLTSPQLVVNFTTAGTYTINLIAQPGGSSPVCLPDIFTQEIEIGVSPVSDFAITSGPATGCAPLQVLTTNNSLGDSLVYNWSVTPATGWDFVLPSNAASAAPGFEFSQAGTYTISLNAANTCALSSTTDTVVVVKGLPTATLAAAQSYCGPQTITFVNQDSLASGQIVPGLVQAYSLFSNAGSITGVQWQVSGGATFANGTTSTSFAPALFFPAAGTYTVSLVSVNECGSSVAAEQVITIHPTANVQISSASPYVCAGQTTQLTGSGTDTYSWIAAPGLTSSANATVSVSPTSATGYTVIGINTTGCADTAVIAIDVKPLPVISAAASPVAFCQAQGSASLEVNGADAYVWFPATGLSGTTGNEVTATPVATAIYTITGTENTFGCANTTTVQVTVHPKPVVNAGADSVVCDQPVPVQLAGFPAGGTWSGAGVSATGVFVPSVLGSFDFTYSYTNALGCFNGDTITVDVMTNPIADAGADTAICKNTPALQLSGWPLGGTWSGTSQVTNNGIFTPTTPGTYTLTYSFAPGSSCASTDQVTITVLALPAAPVASGTTVCYNQAATLSASAPGATAINWYQALIAGTSQGIFLSTGPNFTTPSLTAPEFYNIYAVDGNGCVSTKTQVQVAVTPQVPTPTVANAELCGPGNIAQLQATAPGGIYSWFDAATSGNLLHTGASYTTSALAATTTYYVETLVGQCSSDRQPVTVTVYPNVVNAIGGNQTICHGNTPAVLSDLGVSGGNGTYSYEWQISTSSSTTGFATAPGVNNAPAYAPTALTQTSWFRRVVTSGPCTGVVSNTVEVTVMPAIANNMVTAAQTICAGAVPAALTGSLPTGGDNTFAYHWESSTSGPAGFAPASGANNLQHYTPAALTQTTQFRRKVMSMACEVSISAEIEITVNPVIANNALSAAQTQICEGAAAGVISGAIPTGGSGSFTYVWEESTTGPAAGFAPATGTNTTCNYNAGTLTQTTWYRRTVTSGPCTDVSAAIEINVTPAISNNTISQDQEICFGTAPAIFAGQAPAGGNGAFAFAWEISTSGPASGFVLAPGINNNGTYSSPALSETTWFRRVVTSGACEVISNVVKVTVNPVINNNFVSSTQTIFSGQVPAPLSGTAPTGGNGNFTYLWESSTTSAGLGFAAATGVNNAAGYAPGALTQTTWFRRTVISGGCQHVSDPIVINIISGITNNTILEDQQICVGTTPALITGSAPEGGIGTFGYQWEYSTDGPTAGFVTAPGNSTGINYQSANLAVTTWFRRTVTSGTYTHSSNVVMVTVNPSLGHNSISFSQNICTGSTPEKLTGTIPTGGTGTYTYLWESSVVGPNSGFVSANGRNNNNSGPDFAPHELSQTTWFRRVVKSGTCQPLISEPVLINVSPVPLAPVATGARVCYNDLATITALNPSETNTAEFEWYDKPAGGSLLATGNTFVTPVLTQTATYYVQLVNQSCTSERTAVTVEVTESAANAGPDVAIIAGNSVQLQGSGGVEYTWAPGASINTTMISTGSDKFNPYVSNPTVSPLTTTEYTLIVRSEDGCISQDQVTVTVHQQVQIPNTFSPNNDRINDYWMIAGIENFPNCRLEIFNQWGELVHTNTGITPWDGMSNGKLLPIATYYYILHLDDFEKPLSGSITIIR